MDFFTGLSRFSGTLNFEIRFSNLEAVFYMTMTAAYSKSARARYRNFGITAGGGCELVLPDQ